MTDGDTGETCWGAACFEIAEPDLPEPEPAPDAVRLPANVSTENCSRRDSERIGFAVQWLQGNLPLIDQRMLESPELMFWPGDSRRKFEEKLHQELKFVCIDDKNKCGGLFGITHPVFAQRRINLCTENINRAGKGQSMQTDALYVHLVGHEIGHLVRLNSHSGGCIARYTDGSFSDALGLAAEYAFLGQTYDPRDHADVCPRLDASAFGLEGKPDSMDRPVQAQK
jgi:hypothetical protein